MIIFNDPIPYADHTERAVRLALDMRDEAVSKLAKLWRGRGHDLGLELESPSAMRRSDRSVSRERREYTCIGSVINLASRLCDEAKAGQIVVSQRVLTAVENSVEAAAVGEMNLKGFKKPMAAYDILNWRGERPAGKPAARDALEKKKKKP